MSLYKCCQLRNKVKYGYKAYTNNRFLAFVINNESGWLYGSKDLRVLLLAASSIAKEKNLSF